MLVVGKGEVICLKTVDVVAFDIDIVFYFGAFFNNSHYFWLDL